MSVLILALILIVVGIIMVWAGGSGQIKLALLATVLFWVGVVLIVIGLIFLVTPALIWIDAQLRSMMAN